MMSRGFSLLVAAQADARYPYNHTGYIRFLDPDGYPAIKPPWGQMSAVDLNKGEIVWQVPLGEIQNLTARGIPQTGTQNVGGSLVTAGGLLFIAATQDEKFRAFDKVTGKGALGGTIAGRWLRQSLHLRN